MMPNRDNTKNSKPSSGIELDGVQKNPIDVIIVGQGGRGMISSHRLMQKEKGKIAMN